MAGTGGPYKQQVVVLYSNLTRFGLECRMLCVCAGALRQQALAPYGSASRQPFVSMSLAVAGSQGGSALPLVQSRSISPPRSRSLEMRSV